MYNTTHVYIVPTDSSDNKVTFTFYVFQAVVYLYGARYNDITLIISGGGTFLLIVASLMYLDYFRIWKDLLVKYMEERKKVAEVERV